MSGQGLELPRGWYGLPSLFIDRGAALEPRSSRDGLTPLTAAAYQGHADIVDMLLARGADLHVEHGAPLEWAALFDQDGTVRRLLAAGADPDEKLGHNDNTALISAASTRPGERERVVEQLLDAGADINARGPSGRSALHAAAESGRTDVVSLLLDRGADMEAATDDGVTPVIAAAQAGQLKVVSLLAERGADLDHANNAGQSARTIIREMAAALG